MTSEETVNTLRDVVLRRRRGLPPPAGVDLDELLDGAADVIERLERDLDAAESY